MKTYDINEAAEFLKIDRSTALELVGAGDIPGAKIGRAWVFLEVDLVEYLRDKVRRQTDQRREDFTLRQKGNQRSGNPDPLQKRGGRRSIPSLETTSPPSGPQQAPVS